MKRMRSVALVNGWTFALLLMMGVGGTGSAFQRPNPVPSPTANYPSPLSNSNTNGIPMRNTSPVEDSSMREMEERRGKAINTERRRAMIKDANQLVQAAADLQASVTKGIEGAGREEQAKRAESIEKLAKDVKERMKGGR